MELLAAEPSLDLRDPDWLIHTFYPSLCSARILLGDGFDRRVADAPLCPGSQVFDAQVERSILSPGVTVDHQAEVFESILMDNVRVGPGARIHRAIVDKGAHVPAGYCIGGDLSGEKKGFTSHLEGS
jgi:glucose-1-phosphate adenylyltransferase